MRSRRFKAFLSFNFHWYILIFIGVVFVFYYLFLALRTPTYDEKIVIFIATEYVDCDKLESDLYSPFEDSTIKEVFVDYSNPSDSNFSIVFSTRGTVNTDILILPKDYINNQSYSTFFAEIKLDYIDGNNEFVMDSDGVIYGINVTDFITGYTDNKGEFYLFFNKKSNKIGDLNNVSINNFALQILNNIK